MTSFPHTLNRVLYPFGVQIRKLCNGKVPEPLPMKAYQLDRVDYFRRMMERIEELPGDVVECGVGSGQTLFMLAYWLRHPAHTTRTLIGFDSFAGFPETTTEEQATARQPMQGDLRGPSPEWVRKFLECSGISSAPFLTQRLTLVPGYFQHTLPRWTPRPIALLHLDADLYDSYKVCLTTLFPHVVSGGLVLFDEYHDARWPLATRAVDEFFAGTGYQLQEDAVLKKFYVVKKKN